MMAQKNNCDSENMVIVNEEEEKAKKKEILKLFNSQLIEFIEDVKILFPNKNKISALILGFKTFMKIRKEDFIESWRDWVICKFNDKIMKKDYSFFEPHVVTEEEKKLFKWDISLKFIEAIELLKSIIIKNDEKNKEHTMGYIYNLNMLCIHFYGLTQYLPQ